MKKRKKQTKECPRCGMKVSSNLDRCTSCNLVFSRLEKATNKQGKKELLKGHRQNVVFVKKCPKDVNKIVLCLLSGFLGIFGAHNFYVGRYLKAVYSLCVGIFAVFYVIYAPAVEIFKSVTSIITLLVGIDALFWIFDFSNICMNRYRIPVALEEEEK